LEEEGVALRSSTGSVWCLRNGWVDGCGGGGGSDRNVTLVSAAEGREGDASEEGEHMCSSTFTVRVSHSGGCAAAL